MEFATDKHGRDTQTQLLLCHVRSKDPSLISNAESRNKQSTMPQCCKMHSRVLQLTPSMPSCAAITREAGRSAPKLSTAQRKTESKRRTTLQRGCQPRFTTCLTPPRSLRAALQPFSHARAWSKCRTCRGSSGSGVFFAPDAGLTGRQSPRAPQTL